MSSFENFVMRNIYKIKNKSRTDNDLLKEIKDTKDVLEAELRDLNDEDELDEVDMEHQENPGVPDFPSDSIDDLVYQKQDVYEYSKKV